MVSRGKRVTAQFSLFYGLLIILMCSSLVQAAITVSLMPAETEISDGGSVVVDIHISNPDQISIKSWTLDLAFDPSVLDASLFAAGSYVPSPVMPAVNLDKDADGMDPDIAKVGVLNLSGSFGTAVDGVLGTVTFDGIASGTSAILIATVGPGIESVLLDPSGLELFGVEFVGTSIEVTPEPATICLMAAGGLALIRRRS